MSKIPVLEIFPAIQGEGSVCGVKTVFVRTAGCDFSCSWCDSKFTWDGTEKHNIRMHTAEELYNELLKVVPPIEGKMNFNHVTISGGNPSLIGEGMNNFINILHSHSISVGLETQGSKWKDWMENIDDLTISPKPPSSLMSTNFHRLSEIIYRLEKAGTNFSLKVVVFDEADYDYAKYVHFKYPEIPFYLSVGNPNPHTDEDITADLLERYRWLCEKVISDPEMNDAIVLPQIHALAYGNKRKV